MPNGHVITLFFEVRLFCDGLVIWISVNDVTNGAMIRRGLFPNMAFGRNEYLDFGYVCRLMCIVCLSNLRYFSDRNCERDMNSSSDGKEVLCIYYARNNRAMARKIMRHSLKTVKNFTWPKLVIKSNF